MFIPIFISLLLFTILWIILAPVILYADTIRGKYYLTLPGIFLASVIPGGSLFRIRVWIGFLPFRLDPFRIRRKPGGKSQEAESPTREAKKKRGFGLKELNRGTALAKAIRIRRFYLNIDTDDFLLNAQLIPIFTALNNGNHIRMTANFQGEASLLMDVRTSLGALLLAYIKTKFNN